MMLSRQQMVGDVDSLITVLTVESIPHSQESWYDAKLSRKRLMLVAVVAGS